MRKNTPEIFWGRLDRSGPEHPDLGTPCWLWPGRPRDTGYCYLSFDGSYDGAHRIAWRLTHGEIPAGKMVCHSCDHPPCCNPAHLFLGTALDNTQDMMRKGRNNAPVGDRCAQARLTWPLARELRARYAGEDISISELARQYGFARETIAALLRGDSWKEEGMVLVPTSTRMRGAKIGVARLAATDIPAIREAYRNGESQRQIAARFAVSQCCIRGVVTGVTWRHVAEEI